MKHTKQALVELHVAVLLIGMMGLFAKFIDSPSIIIVLGRVFFAAVTMWVVFLIQKERIRLASSKEYLFFLLQGILYAIHGIAFFQAIKVSSVAIGLLGFATFPVFVTFLEPVFFKERILLRDVISASVVFLGLILIIPEFNFSNSSFQGVLLGILAAGLIALIIIMNRKYVQNHSSQVITFYQNAIAAVFLLPVLVFVPLTLDMKDVALLVLLGSVFTALTWFLFFRSLRYIKAQTASIVSSLEPVYGIIYAYLLLNEVPGLRLIAGGAIILAVSLYVTLNPKH